MIAWIRRHFLGQAKCPNCGHWMDNISNLSFEYYCPHCRKWYLEDVGSKE